MSIEVINFLKGNSQTMQFSSYSITKDGNNLVLIGATGVSLYDGEDIHNLLWTISFNDPFFPSPWDIYNRETKRICDLINTSSRKNLKGIKAHLNRNSVTIIKKKGYDIQLSIDNSKCYCHGKLFGSCFSDDDIDNLLNSL